MTKKQVSCWYSAGVDITDLIGVRVVVGKYYRGFYSDGRQFTFKCTEIDEDGDCIGEGFVENESGKDAIYCYVDDILEPISEVKFKELTSITKCNLKGIILDSDWMVVSYTSFRDGSMASLQYESVGGGNIDVYLSNTGLYVEIVTENVELKGNIKSVDKLNEILSKI